MVTPSTAIFMIVVPVTSLFAALMVVASIISRAAAIVSRIMPIPFAPVAFFPLPMLPLPTLPITTPVVVPVSVPARTNDDSGRRLDIHLLGRSVDRLGCIDSTGDSNVYSNIDMCDGDGR